MIYYVVDGLNSPTYRVCCNVNGISFVESPDWAAVLIRVSRINLSPPPHVVSTTRRQTSMGRLRASAKLTLLTAYPSPNLLILHFPRVSDERVTEVNTDAQAPFCPQDLWQGDNTVPSSIGGRRGRSQCKGSGSCRPPASGFRLRRWKSGSGPWLRGGTR